MFEGCDRVGKTTQADKLRECFINSKQFVSHVRFPSRETPIGFIIQDFLKGTKDIRPECAHLLYSADRWDHKDHINELLELGNNVIADRYSFSGMAYSVARGLNLEWCAQSEIGLPVPDLVIHLELESSIEDVLTKRKGFGDQSTETIAFQEKVARAYNDLYIAIRSRAKWTKSFQNITEVTITSDENVDVVHEFVKEEVNAFMHSRGEWNDL